jgi:hypothetical protein
MAQLNGEQVVYSFCLFLSHKGIAFNMFRFAQPQTALNAAAFLKASKFIPVDAYIFIDNSTEVRL